MSNSGKKIAVVTGAGGGIGSAIARKLAEKGYLVACTDRDNESVSRISSSIPESAHFVCDISKESEVEKLRDDVVAKFGTPTLLVNAAGIFYEHDFLTTTEATFDEMIDVNLKGTFFTCKAFMPGFIELGGGGIINISSTAGLNASSTRPIYSVAKAGVIMLTRSITADYGTKGIRANVICPGLIDTPMANWIKSQPEKLKKWEEGMPAQRIGTVDDIANMVVFLASDESSYMHGSVVVVDGGGLA